MRAPERRTPAARAAWLLCACALAGLASPQPLTGTGSMMSPLGPSGSSTGTGSSSGSSGSGSGMTSQQPGSGAGSTLGALSPSGSAQGPSSSASSVAVPGRNASLVAGSLPSRRAGAAAQSPAGGAVSVAGATTADLTGGQGTIFKKQDSLEPFFANLYGIPATNKNHTDPDILITLEPLNGGAAASIGVYCNPDWGEYADLTNIPQPGFAVWQSDLQSGQDTLFISKTDKLYRPPWARIVNTTAYNNYQPKFICSVINLETNKVVSYRLEAVLINNSGQLRGVEQKALGNIFEACCNSTSGGVCGDWKEQNARKGYLVTDFCTFPRQICTAQGSLLRLDFRNYNLQCPFPATDMAVFTSLAMLNLGYNPQMTGSVSDVFTSLANARKLKYLNLFKARGLGGPFDASSGDLAPTNPPGVCQLAQRSLLTLNADGVGLNGTIPACLLGNSSKLVELHLGNNQLTGTLPDVLPAASRLQILTTYHNQLTGPIPATLGRAAQLTNLDLSDNLLGGTIPPQLGDSTSLKYCVLRHNKLTGSLPSALATAPALETLDVKENLLTTLPREWVAGWPGVTNSTLVNVRTSFNRLQGPFPAALGRAPQLSFLIINNNTLSGTLPRAPNLFQALRALNASNNHFNGTIPEVWGTTGVFTLKPLQFEDGSILGHVFDLSNNDFSGPIPSFLDMTNVQPVAQKGVFLAGNKLSFTCGAQHEYLTDICGNRNATQAAGGGGGSMGGTPGALTTTGGNDTSQDPRTITKGGPVSPVTSPSTPTSPLDGGLPFPYQGGMGGSGQGPTAAASAAGRPVSGVPQGQGQPQPQPQQGRGGAPNVGLIVGCVIAGVAAALLVAVAAFFAVRHCGVRRGGAPPPAPVPATALPTRQSGLKSVGSGLKSLSSARGSKFERFEEAPGVEMSQGRMSGYGSPVAPGGR